MTDTLVITVMRADFTSIRKVMGICLIMLPGSLLLMDFILKSKL
jgi:hypothetical protein